MAAGHRVEDEKGGTYYVVRTPQADEPRLLAGIVLWPDGTACRADVPLEVALNIRTIKAMREASGLKP